MKLLLINPAFFNKDEFEKRYLSFNDWIKGGNLYPLAFEPPLGIASIVAYLKSKGFDASLLDMQALLMDERELADKLLEIKPDVAGITNSLKILKKKVTIDQTKEAVRLAKKYVKVFGFFMIGIPGETIDDVRMTFDLAQELELDRSTWSIFQPLPGPELYETALKAGIIKKEDWRRDNIHFTKCRYNLSGIAAEEIERIYQEINDYFYKGKEVNMFFRQDSEREIPIS